MVPRLCRCDVRLLQHAVIVDARSHRTARPPIRSSPPQACGSPGSHTYSVAAALRYPENTQRASVRFRHLLTSCGIGQKESTASPKTARCFPEGKEATVKAEEDKAHANRSPGYAPNQPQKTARCPPPLRRTPCKSSFPLSSLPLPGGAYIEHPTDDGMQCY